MSDENLDSNAKSCIGYAIESNMQAVEIVYDADATNTSWAVFQFLPTQDSVITLGEGVPHVVQQISWNTRNTEGDLVVISPKLHVVPASDV